MITEKEFKEMDRDIHNNTMFTAPRVKVLLTEYREIRALFNAHLEKCSNTSYRAPAATDVVPQAVLPTSGIQQVTKTVKKQPANKKGGSKK